MSEQFIDSTVDDLALQFKSTVDLETKENQSDNCCVIIKRKKNNVDEFDSDVEDEEYSSDDEYDEQFEEEEDDIENSEDESDDCSELSDNDILYEKPRSKKKFMNRISNDVRLRKKYNYFYTVRQKIEILQEANIKPNMKRSTARKYGLDYSMRHEARKNCCVGFTTSNL